MKAPFKLLKTEAEINTATDNYAKRLASDAVLGHKIACSVLSHVATHKDIRVLRRFLDKIAQQDFVRLNSTKLWFETFGPVTFAKDDKGKETVSYDASKPTKLADAMQKSCWSFKSTEGAPYEPKDIAKLIERLVKVVERDGKETKIDYAATIMALKSVPVPASTAVH